MRLKLILGFLILIFSCVLQLWLASLGMSVDVILATLIAFAFFFDLWELVVFILFGVFIINWQPAVSIAIVLFVCIPIIVYAVRKMFALIAWAGVPIAIAVGFFLFYLGAAPTDLFTHFGSFFVDLVGGLIFGELVFFALLHRYES